MENAAAVKPLRLPVLDTLAHVEQIGAPDQLVELAHPHLRHQFAQLFGDEKEIVDHMLGLTGELAAQCRILGRHTHRTGIEVALAHHDAAFDDKRRGGKTELVSAEQSADQYIATGLHLPVGLHANATAQTVENQRLLGFGKPQFPRRAGVLDRRQRAGTRSAVVTGNHQMIGLGLGHASGYRADANFGNQLDADRGLRIGIFQVMDELRQIFDRVDVMVRRRRNETDAGHRVAQETNVFGNLVPRQLTAFARLGALRHLDLELIGIDQILDGHTKTTGGDLLDRRTQAVTFLELQIAFDTTLADDLGDHLACLDALEACRIFSAFAGIRLAANTVHGNRQRAVRLGRDRAERHGAGGETLDDLAGRLNFLERLPPDQPA